VPAQSGYRAICVYYMAGKRLSRYGISRYDCMYTLSLNLYGISHTETLSVWSLYVLTHKVHTMSSHIKRLSFHLCDPTERYSKGGAVIAESMSSQIKRPSLYGRYRCSHTTYTQCHLSIEIPCNLCGLYGHPLCPSLWGGYGQ